MDTSSDQSHAITKCWSLDKNILESGGFFLLVKKNDSQSQYINGGIFTDVKEGNSPSVVSVLLPNSI